MLIPGASVARTAVALWILPTKMTLPMVRFTAEDVTGAILGPKESVLEWGLEPLPWLRLCQIALS